MKKKFVIMIAAVVIPAMLMGGCATALLGMDSSKESATAGATANSSSIIVADVNGTAIYKDAYDALYSQYESYYSGYSDTSSLQEDVLDYLVKQEVLRQKMQELGYSNLTDDQKSEAKQEAEKDIESYIAQNYLGSNYTDEELQQAVSTYKDSVLKSMNMTEDKLVENYELNIAEKAAYDDITKDVAPSDDEVKAQYGQI